MEKKESLKKILYNIDMIKGFVTEGNMHDNYIGHIIPEQIKMIEKFKEEEQAIAFIKDNHLPNCAEFKIWPEHCVIGTREAELVDELIPYEKKALVYPKNSTDGIWAPGLIQDLQLMRNLREVVVEGCCTDICVLYFLISLSNYFIQMDREIKIFAIKKGMETYNIPSIHDRDYWNQTAYEYMNQGGIVLVDDLKELESKEEEFGLVLERRRK